MFMRFVTTKTDVDSHQREGIFQLVYALLEAGDLSKEEYVELRSLYDWFVKYLPSPKHPYVKGRAIFWYKSSSRECITRMWKLANILRSHDYAIELQTCRWLGNIIYQDEYQAASYPSKGSDRIITKTI